MSDKPNLNVQVVVRDRDFPGPGVLLQLSEELVYSASPEVLADVIDARFDVARATLVNIIEQRTGKKVPNRVEAK